MKRVTSVFIFIPLCLIMFPTVSSAVGLQGIGGNLAIVLPEGDADTTFGLGVVGDLGTVLPQLPQLKGEAGVEYWGDSYNALGLEWSWSSINIDGTGKYYFSSGGGFSPFAGRGLGLVVSRWKSELKGSIWGVKTESSDTDIDLGAHLVGGVDIPVGSNMKFTGQAKYSIGGTDTFRVSGALLVGLK